MCENSSPRRSAALAAGCVLMMFYGQSIRGAGDAAKAKPPRRIAVLPLQNLRPKTDTDWIGAGAAETLTTKLGAVPGLITIERAQVKKVIDENKLQAALGDVGTGVKVGKLVGAERILLGSYAEDAGNLLFNVRVVDVATGVVLSRASLRSSRERIFEALFQLADAVIQSFDKKVVIVDNRPVVTGAAAGERLALTAEQAAMLREWGTASAAAYEAFCRSLDARAPAEQLRWYAKAIALDPRYAAAYNNRGLVHARQGKHQLAIRDFDKAIELDPRLVYVYHNRAVTRNLLGDYGRAIRDSTMAIRLNPSFARAYALRGGALSNRGQYAQGIRDLSKAIELDPRLARAYADRGVAHMRRGANDAAIRDLGKAIELDPRLVNAYNGRGLVYISKGSYDAAVRDFDNAIKLNPRFTLAYSNRGLAYAGKGEHRRAIRSFSQALQLIPGFFQAYHNRAVSYFAVGDYDRAWADVKTCQQLGGRFSPKFLARLRKASGREE